MVGGVTGLLCEEHNLLGLEGLSKACDNIV